MHSRNGAACELAAAVASLVRIRKRGWAGNGELG